MEAAAIHFSPDVVLAWYVGEALTAVVVLWAIFDAIRRPVWQYSNPRKILWVVTLGLGLIIFLPLALCSAALYLWVFRRRMDAAAQALIEHRAAREAAAELTHRVVPKNLPHFGWYPDPDGSTLQRWWDGLGWTELIRD